MSEEEFKAFQILLCKEWGLNLVEVPDFLSNQVGTLFRAKSQGLKTGDLFVRLGVLEEERKNELVDKQESIPAHKRRQFAKWVFEQEPGNQVLQDAKNMIMASVLRLPFFPSLAAFHQCELEIAPQLTDNEELREECKKRGCLPFISRADDRLFLAFSADDALKTFQTLGPQTRSSVRDLALEFSKGEEKAVFVCLTEEDTVVAELGSSGSVRQSESGSLVLAERKLIQMEVAKNWVPIFDEAVKLGGTDIHCNPSIKPNDDTVKIQIRVDGNLVEVSRKSSLQIRYPVFKEMVSYLASETNAVERGASIYKPVSGAIFDYENRGGSYRIKLRPEFYPNGIKDGNGNDLYGCVLRVWNIREKSQSLEELNVSPDAMPYIENAISARQGLILATGPTGAGKSTLIGAMLMRQNEHSKGRKSIASFEDPIEQMLSGVKQVQLTDRQRRNIESGEVAEEAAREGVLKSFLRQDMDIAFIGEIRDAMTAIFAGDISNSGHKTFATFHADSAETALTRIAGKFKGNETYQTEFFTALTHIFNIMLIARCCRSCQQVTNASDVQLNELKSKYGLSDEQVAKLAEADLFENTGKDDNGHQCKGCAGKGSNGKVPYFGVFVVDREKRRLLLNHSDSTRFMQVTEKPELSLNDDLIRLAISGSVSLSAMLEE